MSEGIDKSKGSSLWDRPVLPIYKLVRVRKFIFVGASTTPNIACDCFDDQMDDKDLELC